MRFGTIIVFTILSLLFVSCRKHKIPQSNHAPYRHITRSADTTDGGVGIVINCDLLLPLLLELQDAIYNDPVNSDLIPRLLKVSYDSVSGTFLSVGKGVPNREFPESAWEASMRSASSYDAKRWTLYMKSWHTGNKKHFGEKIEGEIVYSQTICTKHENDTLYTLLQIPVGSIVLKQ